MFELTITARELLMALLLGTLVYLIEGWLFSRRARRRGEQKHADATDRALAEIHDEFRRIHQRLEALEATPPAGSALDEQATRQAEAVRLAQAGLGSQELATRLGMSLTEAELIVALHKPGV